MSLPLLFQKHGLTVYQALTNAGLDLNAVKYWQNDHRSASLRNLYRLSSANNIPIADLIKALNHEVPDYPKLETPVSLSTLIERSGLQQKELAQILKVTPATVCMWFAGTNSPSICYALALCHIFEVNIDDLALAFDLFGDLPPEVDLKKVPLRELFCA